MIHLAFYVPKTDAEAVKKAVFSAGAGKIGNYSECAFEISGIGQFRPLKGSDPTIGNIGDLEKMPELKVEMVCDDEKLEDVIRALKEAHPYETPAYYAIKTLNI